MRFLVIATALCLAGLAPAQAQSTSSIEVTHAWARASAGTTGVVYLAIANHGTEDDRLTAAETSVADKAELHTTLNDKGIMRMRPLADLPVKGGSGAELKPGGPHLMLIGLKHPLKQGEHFSLSLIFEKAGKVETEVTVERAGAMGPATMPGMKM